MKPEDRIIYLEAIARLAQVHADARDADPLRTFLPLPSTGWALTSDVWVILGSRGTGKSALFHLATAGIPSLGELFDAPIPEARWLDCFSVSGYQHPEVGVLEALSDIDDQDLRGLWAALLLQRLADAGEADGVAPRVLAEVQALAPNAAATWAPGIKRMLGDLIGALDGVDAALHASGRRVFCCYDALDQISPFDGQMRRRHIRVLLALWSSLSLRHRSLRAKVFLRDDLLDPQALDFPDASKLRSRSTALQWSHEDLSRLIVRYLAREGEAVREWLGRVKQLRLRHHPRLGWLPGPMPEAVRTAFTSRIMGGAIGEGIFRVEPGRWIVGRLQDARRDISPRTTLRFFGHAGREALHRARERSSRSPILLSDRDLAASIRRTSADRVAELREEYKIVNRMENLSELRIPIRRADAEPLLSRPAALEQPPHEHPGDAVLEELVRLGVVSEYGDPAARLLDVPDIYRYGFGIGVDYSEAFRAYIMNGPESLQLLQRGDLPHVDEIIAAGDPDGSILTSAMGEALRRHYSGNTVSAVRLLETVFDLAQRRDDPTLTFEVLLLTSEVYLTLDPEAALRLLESLRALLKEHSFSARPEIEVATRVQECIALLSLHRIDDARTIAATLESSATADSSLRDHLAWIHGQIALFSGDLVDAARRASALADADDPLSRWRGYLIAASLIIMRGRSPKDYLGSAQGMLPWALSLEGVTKDQLRDTAMLAYLPACDPDMRDLLRVGAEQLAAAYLAQLDDLTLDELRIEAQREYTRDQGKARFIRATAEAAQFTR